MSENRRTNNNVNPIRLDDLLYVALKHYKAIVLCSIIGLVVGIIICFAYYVQGIASVKYNITASMAVTSTNASGQFTGNDSYDPNASDIHLAEDMTASVMYVCTSDTTLNAACEKLLLIGVTADDIRPNLTLAQYNETQIIEMTLVWDNADEGILILNAITEVAPDILIDTLKIGDVTIVNQPKVKPMSLSFIDFKLIAICVALGFCVSAGYFILMLFIHPTYLHSEDVKRDHDFDILGEIPKDEVYFSNKVNGMNGNEFSTIQEYFSACAHVLVYRLKDIEHPCVYLTSTSPSEGKTSITANLGYALSGLGVKTLIIDMDIRNPSMASKFEYTKEDDCCLNSVYRGEKAIEDAVVRIDSYLDILPTKLEAERIRLDSVMIDLIEDVKKDYDFVLIDTAPVGQVSDSLSLNAAADYVIYIVRRDQTWISTIEESVARLKKSGVSILGAIINDAKSETMAYYYSNYNQYKDSPYMVNYPVKKEKKSLYKSKYGRKNKEKNSEQTKVDNQVTEKEPEKKETDDTDIEMTKEMIRLEKEINHRKKSRKEESKTVDPETEVEDNGEEET